MQTATPDAAPLTVVTGILRSLTVHADGTCTVTLTHAPRAPQAPAPSPEPEPAPRASLLQAHAVAEHLRAEFAIPAERVSARWDDEHQAAAVHVDAPHGLYTLYLPERYGARYLVHYRGERVTLLACRHEPATTDAEVGTQYAMYLQSRGDLYQ